MKKITLFATACSFTAATFAVMGGDVESDTGKIILNDKVPALVVPVVDIRARYEYGGFHGAGPDLEDAHAGTIRERIGLRTRKIRGFQGYVEYEGTQTVDRQSYRADSVHGPTNKVVIADPESNELNQGWLSYTAPSDVWGLKVGRQAINIDDQRYIGGVAWRQNMQTFDSVIVNWNPTDDLEFSYYNIWQVNRVFGSDVFVPAFTDFTGSSHLVHGKVKNLPFGTLTGYVYSLDLHNTAGDTNSNTSFGAILEGPVFDTDLTYYLEAAHQIDAYSNPQDYAANYAHVYFSGNVCESTTASIGFEYLGSDNGVGYKFPLGTNHAYNGFGDLFLVTPPGGLTDSYIKLATKVPGDIGLAAFYHFFTDDGFDTGFGQEADVVATREITENVSLLAKGAWFFGQSGFPDVTRASIEMDYKF